MADADVVLLYVTVPTKDEGLRLGRSLVEDRLAACANVYDGATSIFRWEGAVQQENEALLIAKTPRDLVDAATDLIVLEHPYDCPCVLAVPVAGGHQDFLTWINAETADEGDDGEG